MHIKPFTQIWIGLKCKSSITCQFFLFSDNSWGEMGRDWNMNPEWGSLQSALWGELRTHPRTEVRDPLFPPKRHSENTNACDSAVSDTEADAVGTKWVDRTLFPIVSSVACSIFPSEEGNGRLTAPPQHLETPSEVLNSCHHSAVPKQVVGNP